MLHDFTNKIKRFGEILAHDWGIAIVVFLVGFGSFGLGRLSMLEKVRPPVSIGQSAMTANVRTMNAGGMYVASRSGSTYNYPWCAGAAKIAPQNQVWFDSVEAAKKAGYRPAKNCKGLK